MANTVGILAGVAVILIGVILLVVWWSMFIKVLLGVIPVLLILIGAGVLLYFISEIKSKAGMKEPGPSPAGEEKPEEKQA